MSPALAGNSLPPSNQGSPSSMVFILQVYSYFVENLENLSMATKPVLDQNSVSQTLPLSHFSRVGLCETP